MSSKLLLPGTIDRELDLLYWMLSWIGVSPINACLLVGAIPREEVALH